MVKRRTGSAATRVRWSRRELLLAMHLYQRIEFGKQHQGNPEVVALARVLARTPSSVAMKLNNLTSLDPAERARGVKGLDGASELDRAIWAEFHNGCDAALEAEGLWQQALLAEGVNEDLVPDEPRPFAGSATESKAERTVRTAQRYFQRMILSNFRGRCCITGTPVRELLIASHIVPWSEDRANRLNSRNGLCLARTQDAAFERGLIAIDDDYRLLVSTRLREHYDLPAIRAGFAEYEGKRLGEPVKNLPDPELLRRHRKRFRG